MSQTSRWKIPCGYLTEGAIVTGDAAIGPTLVRAFTLTITIDRLAKPPDVPTRMTTAEFQRWKTDAENNGYRISTQDD
jgi:hypothetical protein